MICYLCFVDSQPVPAIRHPENEVYVVGQLLDSPTCQQLVRIFHRAISL